MNKDFSYIVKLTDNCNLRCKYCYHFQHNDSFKYQNMTMETVDAVIESLVRHNHQNAHFIWHGGEPLLQGIGFFKHIADKQQELMNYNAPHIKISNGIQTNGTLLTKEMIDFFVDHDFQIGLSLDGDNPTLLEQRGLSSTMFQRMMETIDYLNIRKARFGVLCVISKESLGHEQEMFDFYVKHKIFHLGLLPMVITDQQDHLDLTQTLSPSAYGDFLCKFFDLWVNSGIEGVSVREFDDFIRFRLGVQKRMCINTGECDLYYTIAPDGSIFACDCFKSDASNRVGSVFDDINNIDQHPFIRNLSIQAHQKPQRCKQCEYFGMCNGGCAYYRWLADHSLNEASFYCSAYKQLYRHMDAYMEENTENGR